MVGYKRTRKPPLHYVAFFAIFVACTILCVRETDGRLYRVHV